jgi:hypothetical protein
VTAAHGAIALQAARDKDRAEHLEQAVQSGGERREPHSGRGAGIVVRVARSQRHRRWMR